MSVATNFFKDENKECIKQEEKIFREKVDSDRTTNFVSIDDLMLRGVNKNNVYREENVRSRSNVRTRGY